MFIKQANDGNWYVCRKTNSHKNQNSKATERDWFLVKHSSGGAEITTFQKHTNLRCPKEFLGKRVRLKIEVIDETNKTTA